MYSFFVDFLKLRYLRHKLDLCRVLRPHFRTQVTHIAILSQVEATFDPFFIVGVGKESYVSSYNYEIQLEHSVSIVNLFVVLR